jgi:tetratricopeptide (TPR) repeat protein
MQEKSNVVPAATPAPAASSETTFRSGMAALERRDFKNAIALFQQAIEQERQEGTKNPRMKYVSYLGYTLTLLHGRSEEGLKLCEQAVKREFFDPDLYCNLGMVYLRNRQKKEAFAAFRKGLGIKPGHRRILDELARYDQRDHPVFGFLPRTHPVNVLAGRLRFRLRSLFAGNGASRR